MQSARIRYRYFGRFISASKAQKLSNLANAKNHIRTDRVIKGHTDRSVPGYRQSLQKRTKEVIIEEARQALKKEKEREKAEPRQVKESRKERKKELAEVIDFAAHVAKKAREATAEVEEKKEADRIARQEIQRDSAEFDSTDYEYYDSDAVSYFADSFIDEEESLEFDMIDLEGEEEYP
jgi:hypothetical protein